MNYGEMHNEEGIGGGIFGGMGDPRVTVYATVDNLETKLKTVNDLGGKTVMEPAAVPGGPTIAMFTDPCGNTTGMILAGTGGAT
jgi:predicted enzyme related to lactoylglutathione lyase